VGHSSDQQKAYACVVFLQVKPRSQVECCGLKEGRDMIVFEEDCGPEHVFAVNFTKIAMLNQNL
jgi:hypothetical protein